MKVLMVTIPQEQRPVKEKNSEDKNNNLIVLLGSGAYMQVVERSIPDFFLANCCLF